MTPKEILTHLSDGAMLLEPRAAYDQALVGFTATPKDHWPRKGGETVAIYDRDLCIEAIMADNGGDAEQATEWFEFNTSGGWYGEGTPVFQSEHGEGDESHYLQDVVSCKGCGERWCLRCEDHWANCDCEGPHGSELLRV